MSSEPRHRLGANPGRARLHNRQLVLAAIRRAGSIGRAEIARASGLSTQAVSNIIDDLEHSGWLVAQGHVSAGRGLPVQQYALNPKAGYAIGVEIRPTALFTGVADLMGHSIHADRTPLPDTNPTDLVTRVQKAVRSALNQTGLGRNALLGAGIVMPGPFGDTGFPRTEAELPGWQDADPTQAFSDALDLPVYLEKDANAAAMAEHLARHSGDLHSFAYLYFGQGLGLAVLHQGQLITGAHGNAGEIGQVPIHLSGSPRPLEDYVSRTSVERHLAANGLPITGVEALEQAHKHHQPVLADWYQQAAAALGQATALIENLFDPQTIVLGGAMPDVMLDHLIAQLDLPVHSVSNRPDRALPRVMRGRTGRMTATEGAAALVLNHTFTPAMSSLR